MRTASPAPAVTKDRPLLRWWKWLAFWSTVLVQAAAGQQRSLCTASGSDVASKAYLSPVVLEGTVLFTTYGTRSSLYRDTPTFLHSAAIRAEKVYKGDVVDDRVVVQYVSWSSPPAATPKPRGSKSRRPRRHLVTGSHLRTNRLGPWSPVVGLRSLRLERGGRTDCVFRPDLFDTGKKYLVFARWSDTERTSLEVIGDPVIHNKTFSRAVRRVLCPLCAQPPSAAGLKDTTVKFGSRLKLDCRVKGNPIPEIKWYKNKYLIQTSNTRYTIRTKRKSSHLSIQKVRQDDGGEYECQASNVVGPTAVVKAKVTIRKSGKPSGTRTTEWPFARPCPMENFCLNGGTCTLYDTVGEFVCQCAEGYKGQRCERKDITDANVPKDSLAIDANTRTLSLYWGK